MSIPSFDGYVNSAVPEIAAIESNTKLPGNRELYPGFPFPSNAFLANLTKVPAKYYLEIRKGSKIDSVVSFPYDPQVFNYSRPTPINIQYTLGGVYRETNSIRRHIINMSGRSGIAHRIGYNRRGQFIYVPGQIIFNEFDEFLKRYTELCTQLYAVPGKVIKGATTFTRQVGARTELGAATGEGVQMILRCLDDDLHLLVEPKNFAWQKNADDARFDCRWEMDFEGYGYPVYPQYRDVFTQALDRFDQVMGLAGGFVGMIGNIVNNISDDYIGRFRRSINNTIGTMAVAIDLASSFEGIWHNAVGVAADFYRVANQGRRIGNKYIQMRENLSNEYSNQLSTIQDNFNNSRQASGIGRPIVSDQNFADIENNMQALLSAPSYTRGNDLKNYGVGKFIMAQNMLINQAELVRGQITKSYYENSEKQNATLDQQYFGSFLKNENNYGKLTSKDIRVNTSPKDFDRDNAIPYPMKAHEDLVSIAHKFFGTTEAWTTLMTFNKWRDSRRNQHGEYPKSGEIILIPREEVAGRNKFNVQGDLIGVDVSVKTDDITFNDKGDISLCSGQDCVSQSIRNVLLTKNDELLGFNDYGFTNITDFEDTTYISAVLRDQLTSDPRIIDVRDIQVEKDDDDDTRINISCKVQTVELNQVAVRAPLSGY
jgi:hypothetical protein